MPPMTLRLELFVRDLAASVAFYRDALGFELHEKSPTYVEARNGDVLLGIGPQTSLPRGHHFSPQALAGQEGAGIEIVLEVDDVRAGYERVVAAGYAPEQVPGVRPWGLTDFRIVDPDGYYLRVTST